MVSIIENWAVIVGTVMGIAQADMDPNTAVLDVQVESVRPYESFPMLVTQKPGERISINVKNIEVGDELLNAPIEVRVRRGRDPDKVFAAPDWHPSLAR